MASKRCKRKEREKLYDYMFNKYVCNNNNNNI